MEERSYIRQGVQWLDAYVPGEQPKEDGVIKLNTNENPYPPSPKVAEVFKNLNVSQLRRYPDPVCLELRRVIAELHDCDVEQVFVGNGSDEILALCARAFVERAGSIGYFDPSYSLYPVLAAIEEIATKPVALTDDFQWSMPEKYEASLFFLTNPNAPTSLLFPKGKVQSFCKNFQGVVVIDEAYVDFAKEDCMDLALDLDNVIVARTLSKSYSLAGLRLGYAVGSPALIDALFKIKDSYNVDYLSQHLALAALRDVPYMRENATHIKKTRAHVSTELQRRGFTVFPSETNFLWVRPPAGVSAKELFYALRDRKIFIRFFSDKRVCDYLRITVGTEQDMSVLIREVTEVLRGV